MRPVERIPIFLDLIDGNYTGVLINGYELSLNEDDEVEIVDKMYDRKDEIFEYWNLNPDLRFSQVLVNLGILDNIPGFWFYKEEHEILKALGKEPREYLLWGKNYDKDMNRLPHTIYKPIMDLETDHIEAILDGGWCKSGRHFDCFQDELKRRNV